jgi:quercetin dioxygenase-like cupin family protein
MTETEHIKQLEAEGFSPVYVWDAEPQESDPDHNHPFDTKLIILEGEITIEMNGKTEMLRKGASMFIPREEQHSGLAGKDGCRYIVGEKH